MNYIDIIIVSVMLFFIGKGFIKGFTREVMGLLSFIIAFVVALSQMRTAANILNNYIDNYSISLIAGYVAVFLFIFIVLRIIAGAIHKLLNIASLGWLNRLGGAVFGTLFGGLLITLLVFILSIVPISGEFPPGKNDSQFYPYFEELAPKIFGMYSKMMPGASRMFGEISESILTDKLLKSGIDMNDMNIDKIKELLGSGEEGRLSNILKNLEGLKELSIKKEGIEERLKSQSKDTSTVGPYEELFKQLNIDSTKKKTIYEIMEGLSKENQKK